LGASWVVGLPGNTERSIGLGPAPVAPISQGSGLARHAQSEDGTDQGALVGHDSLGVRAEEPRVTASIFTDGDRVACAVERFGDLRRAQFEQTINPREGFPVRDRDRGTIATAQSGRADVGVDGRTVVLQPVADALSLLIRTRVRVALGVLTVARRI